MSVFGLNFTPPKNGALVKAVRKLSSSECQAFLKKIKAQSLITVDEVDFMNAVNLINRETIQKFHNDFPKEKNIEAGKFLVDTINANTPNSLAKSNKRTLKILDAIGLTLGKQIKTPAGNITLTPENGCVLGNNTGSTHNVAIKNGAIQLSKKRRRAPVQRNRADTTPQTRPTPKIGITGLTETLPDGTERNLPFEQTSDNRYEIGTPNAPAAHFKGIPLTRIKGGISVLGSGSTEHVNGHFLTRKPFNGASGAEPAFEDRISWIADIAKTIDPNVSMTAPESWNPNAPNSPETVVFEFPSHNTKVLVTRRLGISTLVMKDDSRSAKDLEGTHYRDNRAPNNVWTVDLNKDKDRNAQKQKFLNALEGKITSPKDALTIEKKDTTKWSKRVSAARAILMEFAKIPGLKIAQNDTKQSIGDVFHAHGKTVPDEAIGYEGATPNALDLYLRTSHKRASKSIDQGTRDEAFEDRALPDAVTNLPTGITWAKTLEAA